MQEMQEMRVQSLGQEDPLEEEMASPLQNPCLKNSMDGGAWGGYSPWISKSQTGLNNWAHILSLHKTPNMNI